MFPSTSLARMRFAGKLCKRGAWAILAMGLAVVVIFVITSLPNSNQGGPGPDTNALLTTMAIALLIAIPILFSFLILYAVGAMLDYLSSEKKPQVVDDERVEITSLSEMR
jgi:type VI protein secretion system component VasK